MNRAQLPAIRLDRKPGLTFKAPRSALDKWDKSISAAAAKPVAGEITILGEIDSYYGVSASMVKEALDAIGKAPVLVTLNSPGGDAFEGIAIYNLLRAHPGTINVRVIGMAASAASVIAMSGDHIEMGQATTLMIHSAWGLVVGNRKDLREFADVLDMLDKSVAGVYATRSGLSQDEVLAMMEKETWMSAEDAVEKGFADTAVTGEKKKTKAAATPIIFASANPNLLAAPGDMQRPVVRLSASLPGASGHQSNIPKGQTMKSIAEQILELENKRAANTARMAAVMQISLDAGRSTEKEEAEEFDTLQAQVGTIDADLVRLRALEKALLASATPITTATGADPKPAADSRGGNSGIISVRTNAEKGIGMARFAIAQLRAKGNMNDALSIARNNKEWMATTPGLEKVLMAAVAAGDTTTAGWAAELVYAQNLESEFIELLRPATILGKLTGVTRVPFDIRVGGQSSGTTSYFVGEGQPIPVSKMTTTSSTLGHAKAATLVALDEELIRSSSPSAEMMVRNDMIKGMAQYVDDRFINPAYAGVANVSPASVTYGVAPVIPTGTTAAAARTDVQALFQGYITNNVDAEGAVWVMSSTTALALSLMQNALGQREFDKISLKGGEWFGLPVIVSQAASIAGSPTVGNMIALINAPDIFVADDGEVTITASNEASIQMLDNPTNLSTGATAPTTLVSMFQTVSTAIRGVRFINWAKKRTNAVAYLQSAAYTG